jgi:exopolysaccharide biosynthesis polyprenyl glycosylphosphotransferase
MSDSLLDVARATALPLRAPGAVVSAKRQDVLFGQLVLAADALVLALSFLLAHALRDTFPWYGGLLPLDFHLWVLGLIIPAWLVLAHRAGLASSHTYLCPRAALMTTARVHLVGGLLVFSVLYLARAVEVSRLLMQMFMVVAGAALMVERLAISAVLGRLASRPSAFTRRVLVVGTATRVVARLRALFKARPHWGYDVVGFVSVSEARGDDILERLDDNVYDEIIVGEELEPAQAKRLAQACLERGLLFHTIVPLPASRHARYRTETLEDGLCLMSVEATPQNPVALLVKRAIDIAGACVGLAVCGVAYVVFAPLIRLESAGPVIFRQTRVGRNGRLFTLYKFRTMGCDAEAQKAALVSGNDMSGFLFKMRGDPRVTGIGRVLRRTYLDELPQFWNVLKGDMSLVGTRPPTVDEAACYASHHKRRLSVRPGITGLWQITGNGAVTDFEEVVRLDCHYIDGWSIWLDLQILLRTCVTVARMGGH